MKAIYVKRWRGNERWANLPQRSSQYPLYEINEERSGPAVYKDPFVQLRTLATFLRRSPNVASRIRRLWLNDYHTAETDADISSIIRSCTNLVSASVPSTVLRRLPASELQRLFVSETGNQLYSLELQAVDLTELCQKDRRNMMTFQPLSSVDFSTLRRLKFLGDSSALPITDADLISISRTATHLSEFHITSLSSISISGVMAIVLASHSTLRVLEHSPRSQDGFHHPHPGYLPNSDHHICDILASCPKLESLSISVPSMCAALFANPDVKWRGDCQVRAAHLCNTTNTAAAAPSSGSDTLAAHAALASTLKQARALIRSHARSTLPQELYIELFFADMIFEPGFEAVHGVFESFPGSISGQQQRVWPRGREPSRKGPYGSTGLYGKNDEGLLEDEERLFERVGEGEFLRGVAGGFYLLD